LPRAKGVVRDADPAGFGDAFKPGGDIDPIAENVFALDQHVPDMDADTPFHAALVGECGVPLRCQLLQRLGAFDGADHRTKLDEDAVAGRFDYPSTMLRNQRVGSGSMLAQGLCRARFVKPHQPAVANDVSRKNGG
jgi:hypothetical protein